MEFVDTSVKLPKELFEMIDAVAGVVEELAHGQNVFSAVIGKLGALNKAVDNAKGAVDELKLAPGASAMAGGYLAQRVIDALVKKA